MFVLGQGFLDAAGPRTYGFADTAIGAGWIAVSLFILGIFLLLVDYALVGRSRGLSQTRLPREVVTSEVPHGPRLPGPRLGELRDEDDVVDVRQERI